MVLCGSGVNIRFEEFIIVELKSFLFMEDLLSLFHTSKQVFDFKKKHYYLELHGTSSEKYCTDKKYRYKIIDTLYDVSKQLSLTFYGDDDDDYEGGEMDLLIQMLEKNAHILGSVHTLDLSGIEVDDDMLEYFGNITTLLLDNCVKTQCEGTKHLSGVHTLSLMNTQIEGVHFLGNVFNLNLSGCTDLKFDNTMDLQGIEILNLSFTDITDNDVQFLGHISELDFSGCYNITDISTTYLRKAHTLLLSDTKITDEGVKNLADLIYLDLSMCKEITDEGFKYLGNVKELLLDATYITSKGLQYLTTVNTLSLASAWNMDDACCAHLQNIYTLNISKNHNLTDACLFNFNNVEHLTIYQCKLLTLNGILNIKCKNLNYCIYS